MTEQLSRLLHPNSIAVVGGGPWCQQVVRQLHLMEYQGEIWRVHPSPDPVETVAAVPDVTALPAVPDAAFVAVNRHQTIDIVEKLAAMGAGGAVCFASGFSEAKSEDTEGIDLQARLIAAAGEMPVLGPNCYGFINALDRTLLWPDQHGCRPLARGVAVLTQSSNIAINLTMQTRGLPIAFMGTCGNMAKVSQAELGLALLDDPRVTAIGVHIEGFGDTDEWYRFAQKAYERNVPVVALKIGRSEQAQRATLSHTASLAGSAAGAAALLKHLGIPQVRDLPEFLETLKVLHVAGPLKNKKISSISCSGGEASLIADVASATTLELPPLKPAQKEALRDALGPLVSLSNPLDYHTYIWGDLEKMTAAWLPMVAPQVAMTLIIIDYPRTDASAWEPATEAVIAVRRASQRPVAVVATLPELLPADVIERFLNADVVPLLGMREAVVALEAAAEVKQPAEEPPAASRPARVQRTLSELDAKGLMGRFGVSNPKSVSGKAGEIAVLAQRLSSPLVLKTQGLAHKTEAGGVRLNVPHETLAEAAAEMPGDTLLVEEMVQDAVAELLVGVTSDPAHGLVLSLGAGGTMTQLWNDTAQLMMPVQKTDVIAALDGLRIAPLLTGFRGAPAASHTAIVEAVMALQRCVLDQPDILEAEINPLICTTDTAVAADALIVVNADREASDEPYQN